MLHEKTLTIKKIEDTSYKTVTLLNGIIKEEPNLVKKKLKLSTLISLKGDKRLSNFSINFHACQIEILEDKVYDNKINSTLCFSIDFR